MAIEWRNMRVGTELKTSPNDESVEQFLASVEDGRRKTECMELLELMKEITGEQPKMWGTGIVGFGSYHYRYESGRENDWFLTGFSPRKQNLTVYIMGGFERYDEWLNKLGKYKTGKSCLYIRSLRDIDKQALAGLIRESADHLRENNR